MSITGTEQRLLRVSKLTSRDLALVREGPSLEVALTRPLADIVDQVVSDRLHLAEQFLDMADRMSRSRSDLARPAIARYYYAMYHAMRAVSYSALPGDDHESHSTLFQKGVPSDYPDAATARNALKDARLLRNEADYDPYPQNTSYFRQQMKQLSPIAVAFVATARKYLSSKGNPHV